MKESDILHETENLALIKTAKGLEIHLQGATHAVVVGSPKTEEQGKRFMASSEKYILNLRKVYNHF